MFKNVHYVDEENKFIIKVDTKIYPLEIIMKSSYIFIDDYYIFVDYESEAKVKISFKSKQKFKKEQLENSLGEFFNELVHQSIRVKISRDTSHLREIILGRALYGACIEINEFEKDNQINEEMNYFKEGSETVQNSLDEIATDWFEKNSQEG
ncbi:MAG: His-Xaa-Ser system protein HxsD [Halanaerobiales bacterium]|nr:His-Xaa-Ser system protein HxsD [Halanaerobiales bacterium]